MVDRNQWLSQLGGMVLLVAELRRQVLGFFQPPVRESAMPVISRFFGVSITMFYDDHSPPHFHATYSEHRAMIGIKDLAIRRGQLPR